ncbi:hypothetical protein TNCV_857241 [Trichonephila clavipes]|nr:hypothetical protein TNCV_857241 [Trichonephila clavipes]
MEETFTFKLTFWRSGVLLLDDNARPHSATASKPYCNSWFGAPTPSTSPDLAPSDFHMLLALKKNLA